MFLLLIFCGNNLLLNKKRWNLGFNKKFDLSSVFIILKVCRHGDRAPCDVFPNNKNVDKWVQGIGYLTPLGESELYGNGKSFRELWYPGLLSDVVYPSEIKVISSDIHRAIMSAYSFLASLYPPSGSYVFEKGLNWQAFPVHTISLPLDYVSLRWRNTNF